MARAKGRPTHSPQARRSRVLTPLPMPAPHPALSAPLLDIRCPWAPSWVPAPTLLGTRVLLILGREQARSIPALGPVSLTVPLSQPVCTPMTSPTCPPSSPAPCSERPACQHPVRALGVPPALSGPERTAELSSPASLTQGVFRTPISPRCLTETSLTPPFPDRHIQSHPQTQLHVLPDHLLCAHSHGRCDRAAPVVCLKLCEESLLLRIEATALNRPSRAG